MVFSKFTEANRERMLRPPIYQIAIEVAVGQLGGNGSVILRVREGHINRRFESWVLYLSCLSYIEITSAIQSALCERLLRCLIIFRCPSRSRKRMLPMRPTSQYQERGSGSPDSSSITIRKPIIAPCTTISDGEVIFIWVSVRKSCVV